MADIDPVADCLAAWHKIIDFENSLPGTRTPVSTAVPRLLAAVEAVLTTHRDFEGRCTHCWEFCTCIEDALPGPAICTTEEMHRAAFIGWDKCPHGNVPWPCPTYRAIAHALLGGGESGG